MPGVDNKLRKAVLSRIEATSRRHKDLIPSYLYKDDHIYGQGSKEKGKSFEKVNIFKNPDLLVKKFHSFIQEIEAEIGVFPINWAESITLAGPYRHPVGKLISFTPRTDFLDWWRNNAGECRGVIFCSVSGQWCICLVFGQTQATFLADDVIYIPFLRIWKDWLRYRIKK